METEGQKFVASAKRAEQDRRFRTQVISGVSLALPGCGCQRGGCQPDGREVIRLQMQDTFGTEFTSVCDKPKDQVNLVTNGEIYLLLLNSFVSRYWFLESGS